MTSPLFAKQFDLAPTYPVGLPTGTPRVGATLPIGGDDGEGKSTGTAPTSKVPSPVGGPNVGPVATGAEAGVSAPNVTPTSFSPYFDQTATSPRTIDPSTLGPNSGNAAPKPVPSPAPGAPARAAAQPADNNPLGGFGHWASHTFDSVRHGTANAADKFGGTFAQQGGIPNQYSPHVNNSDVPSYLSVPNYSSNSQPGVSVPRGLNAVGGFSSRSAPVNPQQFIEQPSASAEDNGISMNVAPGVDLNSTYNPDEVLEKGYDYSRYDLLDIPQPNTADRVTGIPSPAVGAIEAPKTDYSQYFGQQGDYQNANLNSAQFGNAASDAGSSAGSDGGSWLGTFLRDFGDEGE